MNQDTSGIKTTKIIAEDISHWHFEQASLPTLKLITGMFRYIYLSYVVLLYSCTLLSVLSYENESVCVWIIASVFALSVNIDGCALSAHDSLKLTCRL